MIGLTTAERRLYRFAKAFVLANGFAPDLPTLIASEQLHQPKKVDRVGRQVDSLIKKGFLNPGRLGVLAPVDEPTHDRIMRDICERNSIAVSEITSGRKSILLVRCRRLIARELRRIGYSYASIGAVLHRNHSSVYDYFFPARTQLRSRRRSISLYGERVSP
jgi:hypothetical protein